MYLHYNVRAKIFGSFLAETNKEGFVESIEVEGRDDASSVIQQGQCMGRLFLLMNVKINNFAFLFCILFT